MFLKSLFLFLFMPLEETFAEGGMSLNGMIAPTKKSSRHLRRTSPSSFSTRLRIYCVLSYSTGSVQILDMEHEFYEYSVIPTTRKRD